MFSKYLIQAEQQQQKNFNLLTIPDDQLTEEQLELKKRQRVLKNLQDSRLRAKQTHEDCKELMDEGLKLLEENKEDAFQAWVERVRKIRQVVRPGSCKLCKPFQMELS